MSSHHQHNAYQPPATGSYDSSSVSSTASPQSKVNPNMSFANMGMPNRSTSNLSPFETSQPPTRPMYNSYNSGSISPNDRAGHTFDTFLSEGTTAQENTVNQAGPAASHNAKRAYRQRRKDPSCDACRERKVKCDATDTSSCSECSSRNVRCQFTKETNRRMSSIKQVQDLERQLFQARQQVEQLKAMVSKDDLSSALNTQFRNDMPAIGLPPSQGADLQLLTPRNYGLPTKRPTPSITQDLSQVRSNARDYGRGIFKVPTPYRQLSSQHGLPAELPRLPPKQIADHLLSQYFNHIHLRFPIIHQPTFYAEYEKVYQEGTVNGMRRGWTAVLFCIFACGSLHTLEPRRVQDGKEYLTKGTAMVDFWSDELTVDQAKMNFLVSIFLLEINLKSASWVWLGAAARIAQDVGLHVEAGPWPAIEGEVWRRVWYCIYAFDRLLALELGKPLMIDDNVCDTEYPEPVDDQYITHHGVLHDGQSTSLLATLHVVRSIQTIVKLLKAPCVSPETIHSCDQHFDACRRLLAPPLVPIATEQLDPRLIVPMMYLQNVRLILYRHNLSPSCTPDARYRAVDLCVDVALETSRLITRCFGVPSTSASRYDFAVSATTLLCTHLWRCTLFLIFRGEYESASTLVHALSAIDSARNVTIDCGRNISFFLRCILERLQSGVVGNFERDEELMAYVSGDMQASAENSWIWQDSETGANLNRLTPEKGSRSGPLSRAQNSSWPPFARASPEHASYDRVLVEEKPHDWDGWKLVEDSLHYLWEEQQRQRQQQRDGYNHRSFGSSPSMRPGEGQRLAGPLPPLRLQPPLQQQQTQQQPVSPNASRMTIANII